MANLMTQEMMQEKLAELMGWEVVEGELTKTYQLGDFAHAVLMIGAIGQLAEAANHHPELMLHGYNRLTVSLVTHSAGGLTEKDFLLAAQIEALPQKKK